jgi:hypothetical protein
MTTTLRFPASIRVAMLSTSLLLTGASIALADAPTTVSQNVGTQLAARQTDPTQRSAAVLPNNGLCSAQDGVPMADCDVPHAAQAGGSQIDFRGFPYNLPSGG